MYIKRKRVKGILVQTSPCLLTSGMGLIHFKMKINGQEYTYQMQNAFTLEIKEASELRESTNWIKYEPINQVELREIQSEIEEYIELKQRISNRFKNNVIGGESVNCYWL